MAARLEAHLLTLAQAVGEIVAAECRRGAAAVGVFGDPAGSGDRHRPTLAPALPAIRQRTDHDDAQASGAVTSPAPSATPS
jgi:hypothetical protein